MLIETVTGKLVDIQNPTVDQIDIQDIAWGLSRISRFCGHTITEIPYNVAHHSIFVAEKVEELLADQIYIESISWDREFDGRIECPGYTNTVALKALLHDAAEVYTGDWPSPIKQIPELRPIIVGIEDKLMEKIYEKFNLSPPTKTEKEVIKRADKIAQKTEAHAFMQSRGKHWEGLPEVSLEELQKFQAPLPSLVVYKMFMEKFNKYSGESNANNI